MKRVKIKLPRRFIFRTEIPVTIGDINYGGHLGHDSMLTLMHEVRVRFLREHGFTEMEAAGAGLIMRDAALIYKREVFHGQVLEFELGIVNMDGLRFDFVYKAVDIASGLEVARGMTGMVFFDYEKRKIAGVPESFMEKFGGF